ncbi:hypothetical protein CONPUDRAFT_137401 [Coniophora puteana RWD-64-598 SS2]|uniref:Uncharacterized protein n=1 Tax=Coniophora puteana (strain RWD-64-598) TaxID=741705 RepID=A0A5M3MQX5_CONPW|nr:uncharacterized protein CONPUDRAFT_137401 [Coniophora puteana RWD-64-598 SS2]EIW81480.1 hypothetical protein CONPUDRAFT_137401 [Coniophora puteana RWD-64-598 SS2]
MPILLVRSKNPEVSTVVQVFVIVGVLVGVFAFASLLIFTVHRLRHWLLRRTESLGVFPSTTTLEEGRARNSDSVATLPLYSKAALDEKVDVPSGPAPSYEEQDSPNTSEDGECVSIEMPTIPSPARTMDHFSGSGITSHPHPFTLHAS